LLSAIPVPDPIRERQRVLKYYDGEGMENSVWTEVSPGHFAMLPDGRKGCSI
jgi:oligopeptide transport system ATP-binding protein